MQQSCHLPLNKNARFRYIPERPLFSLISLGAVLFLFIVFIYFRPLIPAAHLLLALVLVVKLWLMPEWPYLVAADYISLAVGLVGLLRLVLQPFDVGIVHSTSLFTGLVLYWTIRTIHHRRMVFRIATLFFSLGGTVVCIGWMLHVFAWMLRARVAGFQDITNLKAMLSSPWGGILNDWASVLGFVVAFSILNLQPVRTGSLGMRILSCIACFMPMAALLFTFSRTAYVGLLLLIAGVFAAVILQVRNGVARLKWAVIVLAITVAAVIATNILSAGAVMTTAKISSTEQQRRSASGRIQVWSGALAIAATHWLFGTGPGTFAMHYVPYLKLEEGGYFVGRPLNTGLGLLVEEGVVGLTLQVILAFAAVGGAIRRLNCLPSGTAYSVAVLVTAISVFWIREMAFSSLLEEPLVMSFYWILLAFVVMRSTASASALVSERMRPTAWVNASLVLLSVTSISLIATDLQWKRLQSAARVASLRINRGNFAPMPGIIGQQHRSAYFISLRALAAGLRAVPVFNPATPFSVVQGKAERAQLQNALSDYEQAIQINPNDDLFWYNRAVIRLTLGIAPAAVLADFQRAIQIDGTSAPYRVAVGLLYELNGGSHFALEQYAAAIAAAPDILDSAFAHDLQKREPKLWDAAIHTAIGRLETLDPHGADIVVQARLARIYLEDGHRERGEAILHSVVKAMPQYSRPWVTLARLDWNASRFDMAEANLSRARFLDPTDAIVLAMLAKVARDNGDEGLVDTGEQKALAYRPVSSHANRVRGVYKTTAVVWDDVLPDGLLAYCSPSPESLLSWP